MLNAKTLTLFVAGLIAFLSIGPIVHASSQWREARSHAHAVHFSAGFNKMVSR